MNEFIETFGILLDLRLLPVEMHSIKSQIVWNEAEDIYSANICEAVCVFDE